VKLGAFSGEQSAEYCGVKTRFTYRSHFSIKTYRQGQFQIIRIAHYFNKRKLCMQSLLSSLVSRYHSVQISNIL
jgi:hypothetical protein